MVLPDPKEEVEEIKDAYIWSRHSDRGRLIPGCTGKYCTPTFSINPFKEQFPQNFPYFYNKKFFIFYLLYFFHLTFNC
jgi:hypothetical protein